MDESIIAQLLPSTTAKDFTFSFCRLGRIRWPNGLDSFEFGEILRIDEADWYALRVHDNQVVDVSLVEDVDGIGGEGILTQRHWFACHDLGQRLVEYGIAFRQMAAQVTIGKDSY